MSMERKFENSVLFELRNYKGFIFNPIQIFDVLYNEKSQYKTKAIENIIKMKAFSAFAKKLQTFGNGTLYESFENIALVELDREQDLSELRELFAAAVDDFKMTYFKQEAYSSYCYAVLIVSIARATEGYFSDSLLYRFVHFCRKNAILNI